MTKQHKFGDRVPMMNKGEFVYRGQVKVGGTRCEYWREIKGPGSALRFITPAGEAMGHHLETAAIHYWPDTAAAMQAFDMFTLKGELPASA